MNKRLRKKLHRGEFVLMGATIEFQLPGAGKDDETEAEIAHRHAEHDRLLDDFLAFADAHMLGIGGGIREDGFATFFVTKYARSKAKWRKRIVHASLAEDDWLAILTYLHSIEATDISMDWQDVWR